jgi:imidazolonepropionase
MSTLVIDNARVVTPDARSAGWLRVLPRARVVVNDGSIRDITASTGAMPAGATVIDAAGRVLLPGFVDCHTHACWAGDRLDEWEMKRGGMSYLEILARGGGIMSTVRAVRAASEDDLATTLLDRLQRMLREGTTTVEVKSGYGLTTHDELKMLRAIRRAAASWAGSVAMTALLGHAIDASMQSAEAFVEQTINEALPAVSREFPGIAIDAYCETAAWSVRDCTRLFEAARALGHPVRVHTDQFNSLGMVREATRLGAVSVDHLEASSADTLAAIARSKLAAVLLPCAGFHTDGRYARGGELVSAGISPERLAIATNCNPGSAPCHSMAMAIALATRFCGLSPPQAMHAATAGGAHVLGLTDRGRIEVGMRADLVLLYHRDERLLAYEFGSGQVDVVIANGRVVGL